MLKQLLPDRCDDFIAQYRKPSHRKNIGYDNYSIEDYFLGLQVTRGGEVIVNKVAACAKFLIQIDILSAVKARFESSLFEIRQLVQADLFDSEVGAARELMKNKFLRAAGAIAGVVIERHLLQVCEDHKIGVTKKNPTIGDLNEALKSSAVIDVPTWRYVTMLADIRNVCDHNKKQEPTEQQVTDLVDGADRVLKTIS